MKDEFLATLSHELRTPLNAILGYSRMIRSGLTTGEKQERAIATVERNATSLTQIVEDVLDVSRIISGKLRLNGQPVELPGVVVVSDTGFSRSTTTATPCCSSARFSKRQAPR